MIRILFLLISFSVFLISPSIGQQLSTQNKKAIKLYQEADIAIHSRDWKSGIILLKEAIEKDTSFIEAYAKLGTLYRSVGDHENAKPYIFKAVSMKSNAKDFIYLYQFAGEYYLKDGDYENAQKYYQMVVSLNPDKIILMDDAKRNVEQCKVAIEIKKHPVNFQPVPLSDTINKFYLNAYPVLTADQNTLIYYKTDGPGNEYKGDIMVANMVNGKWTQPSSISSKINSPLDEGTPTMSADGKVMVFTACNRPGTIGTCDLYISYKNGNDWSDPINLGPNVNSTNWDSEPSLSADGRTIYFSSERKGGVGMSDIWMSQQNEKGEWQQAVNVGKPINTPGREVSPFIHADGKTLYFCSSYHPGLGQFDIFFSTNSGNQWSEPKNLGYPINTHLNEATVFITPDNKKGLYVMYEKKGMKLGRCKLYQFEVPKEIVSETISTYAKGNVFDADTKQKIGASIELIDLQTGKTSQLVNSDSKNGDYLIVLTEGKEYALYVQKEGYLFKSVFFDYKNPKEFNPLTLDVYLEPVKSGKGTVLNNIFFQSNSSQIEDKSKTELDKIVLFLKNNPKVNIEFGGHTDDVGSDKDNLDLSQRRAKAVYDYIVGKGVTPNRMKHQGYGESKPMNPNTNEENRQKNRRIEFKIL